MSQETPRPNRIHLLRTQLWAWTGETAYRDAVRLGAPRSREAVPVIDLMHEAPGVALATLLGLLEQDRFDAPVLLIERGLDEAGTPFLHHENATAALGAACIALENDGTAGGEGGDSRSLLSDLVGVWLIAAVADFPEAHEGYLRDLARGMGLQMVPRGWAGTLLHTSPGGASGLEGLAVGLVHEALVERAPGLKLRTVRAALEALDAARESERPKDWRQALAFVVGSEFYNQPLGRLRAEYQAHHDAPASRHRLAVEFIEREALPTYHSVRD